MQTVKIVGSLLVGAAAAAALSGATAPAGAETPAQGASRPSALSETTYDVVHSLAVKDLPQGAQKVRVWFWMPEDRPQQRVLDFRIAEAPDGVRITRDPTYGRSWVFVEAPATGPVRLETRFTLRRSEVRGLAVAENSGTLTEAHRRTFARELRTDEKHMEVTPELRKIADELCGSETNVVRQARKIFDYVILKSDHYSKFGPKPKGQCLGDAMECLVGAGDCCTDQHALFIALARARGIPCRLVFGSRLKPENAGKDHDPGYRCWPTFFAPGLGWVPLDISSADVAAEGGDAWFGGLDDRRVEWAEGRDFDLEPRSAQRPDLVIPAWVEVDGKRHTGFERVLRFVTPK